MAFVGTYEHSLDGAGRLVLPSRLRSHFEDWAYLSPDAGCMAIRTPEHFDAMVARVQEKVRAGEHGHDVLRGLAADSSKVRLDSQGRLLLPDKLRALAGLEREVVLCGAIDWIEVWPASAWPALAATRSEAVADAFAQGIGV
ncbi:MAG: hypothetical protein QF575_09160 [Acidimicrobiales bacterium]|jgi:MraZ protein|nr:hypothetical protein [Acidimicrobiaceae bacterium]MDP6976718.1 hypothetical protein [Acidimicrobiales bacterium]|tara:strand:- start:974 stop:1399 length:426 start_codon:yes stop_codon:yes gene_type:complete